MRETSGTALPRHDSISASKELVRVSGPARQLDGGNHPEVGAVHRHGALARRIVTHFHRDAVAERPATGV